MKLVRLLACAAPVLIWAASDAAVAMPRTTAVSNSDTPILLVRHGYGPLHYGLYGKRRPHRSVPNGTGYRGRGSKSGGPAGGLPGRS